jgi:molecular chaperone HtpG
MSSQNSQDPHKSSHQLGINVPNLIKLLGANLYSSPEIAFREIIQNASDSCIRRSVMDKNCPKDLRIRIHHSRESRQDILHISDTGAGMTRQEIQESLSTIGSSITREFKNKLMNSNREAAEKLIGQFGLGLLSAFTVAHRVEIITTSYYSSQKTFRWVCEGDQNYRLDVADSVREIGTTVKLYLDDKYRRFTTESGLRELIKKYADLISFPIYVGQSVTPVNAVNAPWHDLDAVSADYQSYVEHRFGESPLFVVPIRYRDESVTISGLLYIPAKPMTSFSIFDLRTEIDVHISRIFVCSEKKLLPSWACFIKGVIDSPSLEPTVSRESVIYNSTFEKVSVILNDLSREFILRVAKDDPQSFKQMVTLHGVLIKAGAIEEDLFFETVKNIVPFDYAGGQITMPQYLERVKRSRIGRMDRIYYYSDSAAAHQFLTVFQAQNVPVIDAEERVDQRFLHKYAERSNIELVNIESGTQVLFEELNDVSVSNAIWAHFRPLCDNVKIVRFEPSSIPALIVWTGDKPRRDEADRNYVLYINANSAICQLLPRFPDNNPVIRAVTKDIFEHARVFSKRQASVDERRDLFETHAETIRTLLDLALALIDKPRSSLFKKWRN